MAESHEKADCDSHVLALRACHATVVAAAGGRVCCAAASDGATPPAGGKVVHFIRHGEGTHNVAQREHRSDPTWDGASEPYTLDTDPAWRYLDAELNEKGRGQAAALQERTAALSPELLVVSPMRRATQTALAAFDAHVRRGALRPLAQELCHERAGKHTCDKRLPRAELAALYPSVDYSLLQDEDDPYWGDGRTRESVPDLAARAGQFVSWLMARPERRVAVACHSAILLAIFNAVLECEVEATSVWFGTGELRTVVLTPAAL